MAPRRPTSRVSVISTLLLIACWVGSTSAGVLFDYCFQHPDPSFAWAETGYTVKGEGFTGHLLNVTSQTWLSPDQVSRSVWHHQLMVFVPDTLQNTSVATIYNTGGENPLPTKPPGFDDPEVLIVSQLAAATGTITAIIWQCPNQPLVFAADPTHARRVEGEILAFTWFEFLRNTSNTEIVVQLPMTKAVVKGMDAVTEFVQSKMGHTLSQWIVSGASKRGWSTWLVGGVDDRVVGIAPIVFDYLNLQKGILHQPKAYGGWSFTFSAMWGLNITESFVTPEFGLLADIIDPLKYAANLTMPKLVIDATGDEFFMPDDDQFWWGMLPGETYRLMVANADHTFITGLLPLYEGLSSFVKSIVIDAPRPVITWDIAPTTGTITVTSNVEPTQAVLRSATTRAEDGGRRDFRLLKGDTAHDPCHTIPVHLFGDACINPVFWIGEDLDITKVGDAEYRMTATMDMPAEHTWRGFLVDMYLPGPAEGFTYRMTTQVSIIPQTFPFPACTTPESCKLFLV